MGYMGADIRHTAPGRFPPSLSFASFPATQTRVIGDEPGWRHRPAETPTTRILATRWSGTGATAIEVNAETAADCHVICLVLRPMDIRLTVSGRVVHDGIAAPGMMHVSEPASSAQGLFRG